MSPQCLSPLMAGFGQRDKGTFTRQQQLADRPRVSVCPGCRAAPRGHYVGVCPRGSSCQGNGTREGESSLFPACPCCQPTGHTQERSPSPNTVGKGCQHCRAECLEVWRCLSRGCLCSLSSSTPEALFFCPAGQAGSCSLNQLLFLHLLHAVLVLLVPFLYFLGGTLTWRQNYPWISRSFLSLLWCASSSDWDLICRILGTPIKQGLLTLLYKSVDIDISTHSEHSL